MPAAIRDWPRPEARSLKVALDVRPALSRPTGVGKYVGALAAFLPVRDPGSLFTLFSSSFRERWTRPGAGPNVEIIDRAIPVHLLNFAWNRLSWPSLEKLCGRTFDLVHSPHPLLIPARRARQIITIHDLFFLRRPGSTSAEIRRDYAPLVRAHAARADGIVCPSQHTAREIESLLGVPRGKICVIPHGVDAAFRATPTPGDVEAVLRRLDLARGGILYLGSDEKRKNLRTLVRAYQTLAERLDDPPPLVLVGPGGALDERPTVSGPRVASTGYLETGEIRALMSASKCLVLASLDEGFGFPVVEAMAAGLPVVCSGGSALEEITGGAAELIADPLDEAAIVEGLSRVVEDPDRAAELRTAGLQRSRLFDWDRSADLTLAFYRRVLGS